MSRNKKPIKAYRPRPVTADTMVLARHNASRVGTDDVETILKTVRDAFKALREGVATELQWSVLAGSLDVALTIEHQRAIHGLHEHFKSAELALQAIYDRAMTPHGWRPTCLNYSELDDINAFVSLHSYQARNLARSEFIRALDTAQAKIRSNGDRLTVMDDFAAERMAA